MPFTNAIAGGNGSLVRNDIQSPNYVAGVSGWRINKDGTSEFNSGFFRSSVQVGPNPGAHIILDATTDSLQVYDAGNNLIATVSPTSQTIGGIAVLSGIESIDPVHPLNHVRLTGGQIQVQDQTNVANASPGLVSPNNQPGNGGIVQMLLNSGSIGGVVAQQAEVQLISESGDGSFSSWVQLTQQKAGPGTATSGQAVQTSGFSASEPFIIHTGAYTLNTNASGQFTFNHGANFTPTTGFLQQIEHGLGTAIPITFILSDTSFTSTTCSGDAYSGAAHFANNTVAVDGFFLGKA